MDRLFQRISQGCIFKNVYVGSNGSSYLIMANNKEVLEKLEQYLAPFMRKGALTKEIYRIYIYNSKEVYASINNMKDKMQKGFYLKIEETLNYTIYAKEDKNLSIHVSKDNSINLGFIQDIYCDIREKNMIYKNMTLLVHGASIEYKNKGIMIVGEKGSGKSYLSDYAIFKKGARLVASDQTVVRKENDKFLISGNITSYRINVEENTFLNSEQREKMLGFISTMVSDPRRITGRNKLNLSPMEAEKLLHINISQNVVLNYIVILCEKVIDPVEMMQQHILKKDYKMSDIENIVEKIPIYYVPQKAGIELWKKFLDE